MDDLRPEDLLPKSGNSLWARMNGEEPASLKKQKRLDAIEEMQKQTQSSLKAVADQVDSIGRQVKEIHSAPGMPGYIEARDDFHHQNATVPEHS